MSNIIILIGNDKANDNQCLFTGSSKSAHDEPSMKMQATIMEEDMFVCELIY